MVYIIQCITPTSSMQSKLESYREDFIKQIKEGVLVLPGIFKFVQTVDEASDIDVRFFSERSRIVNEEFQKEEFYAGRLKMEGP